MTEQQVNDIGPDDEEEFDEPEIIRAKWTMDGATTLAGAAAMLRAFADELDRKHAEGWTLRQPVDDDYGFLNEPEGHTS
jgi:hypothetical protein